MPFPFPDLPVHDLEGATRNFEALSLKDILNLGTPTSGQIIVANASGVPVYVTSSGDVTVAAGGAFTIGAGKVVPTMLSSFPTCRVYNDTSANNATTTGVTWTVTFNQERFDTDSMHEGTTHPTRITFNTAGVYLIVFNGRWAANAVGTRLFNLSLNGTTTIASHRLSTASGGATNMSVETIYKVVAGDYVEVLATQDSGGNLNIEALGNLSPEFSAHYLGSG